MIQAKFYKHDNVYTGFNVSGHAGFAEHGQDIVCAGVSSALQMTVNGICEILNAPAEVSVQEDEIILRLTDRNRGAEAFITAFQLHLSLLSEDYENMIQLSDVEV